MSEPGEIWGHLPDGSKEQWDKNKMYQIDGTKIKTLNDVAVLIDAIQISFGTDHQSFENIKHLLKK